MYYIFIIAIYCTKNNKNIRIAKSFAPVPVRFCRVFTQNNPILLYYNLIFITNNHL